MSGTLRALENLSESLRVARLYKKRMFPRPTPNGVANSILERGRQDLENEVDCSDCAFYSVRHDSCRLNRSVEECDKIRYYEECYEKTHCQIGIDKVGMPIYKLIKDENGL